MLASEFGTVYHSPCARNYHSSHLGSCWNAFKLPGSPALQAQTPFECTANLSDDIINILLHNISLNSLFLLSSVLIASRSIWLISALFFHWVKSWAPLKYGVELYKINVRLQLQLGTLLAIIISNTHSVHFWNFWVITTIPFLICVSIIYNYKQYRNSSQVKSSFIETIWNRNSNNIQEANHMGGP